LDGFASCSVNIQFFSKDTVTVSKLIMVVSCKHVCCDE